MRFVKLAIISEIGEKHQNIPDEGLRKFAVHLAKELRKQYDVLEIRNLKQDFKEKVLWNKTVLKRLITFKPHFLFLIPTNLQTIARFHTKYGMLKLLGLKTKVVLFCMQPLRYRDFWDQFLRFGLPDWILTQSPSESEHLKNLGVKSEPVPSGVDLDRFVPVSAKGRLHLRKKYDISPERFVVLHVGHLNPNRNVGVLADIKSAVPESEVLLVVPPSGHVTPWIAKRLQSAGVRLYQQYIRNIEEIYQLSDLYVFPVEDRSGAIGFPLSITEAMACNLPVISTPFEALPFFLQRKHGFHFAATAKRIPNRIRKLMEKDEIVNTRIEAEKFSWFRISENILTTIKDNS